MVPEHRSWQHYQEQEQGRRLGAYPRFDKAAAPVGRSLVRVGHAPTTDKGW